MNLPCKELKRIARDNLNGNYKIPMGAFLAATLIPLAVELPFSMLQKDTQPLPVTIMFYVAEFLITLLSMVLSVGILQLHLSLARKKEMTLGMVFYGFKNHPDRFILTGFILTLLQLAALAPLFAAYFIFVVPQKTLQAAEIILALILVVISLVLSILLQLIYTFPLYLLLDAPDMSAPQAMHASRLLMKKQKGRLFYIYLSFIGMQLLNLLTLGIGSLWIMPYQQQTLTSLYLELRGELPVYEPVKP